MHITVNIIVISGTCNVGAVSREGSTSHEILCDVWSSTIPP